MANIYSDMGRFLQESFSIDDTFKKSAKKSLNESINDIIKYAIEYYRNNSFGYSSLKDYVETDFAYFPKAKQNEIYKKMKKALNLKEDYETDVDLPYDPDAPYNVYADTQSDPDAPYNVDMDSSYESDAPYNVNMDSSYESDAPYNVNESFSDARPGHTRVLEFVDDYGVDAEQIFYELLRYLPDSTLVNFADYYGNLFMNLEELDESL